MYVRKSAGDLDFFITESIPAIKSGIVSSTDILSILLPGTSGGIESSLLFISGYALLV